MIGIVVVFVVAAITVWTLGGIGVAPARWRPLELGLACMAVALVLIPKLTTM